MRLLCAPPLNHVLFYYPLQQRKLWLSWQQKQQQRQEGAGHGHHHHHQHHSRRRRSSNNTQKAAKSDLLEQGAAGQAVDKGLAAASAFAPVTGEDQTLPRHRLAPQQQLQHQHQGTAVSQEAALKWQQWQQRLLLGEASEQPACLPTLCVVPPAAPEGFDLRALT